jgi:hypothetical protein
MHQAAASFVLSLLCSPFVFVAKQAAAAELAISPRLMPLLLLLLLAASTTIPTAANAGKMAMNHQQVSHSFSFRFKASSPCSRMEASTSAALRKVCVR